VKPFSAVVKDLPTAASTVAATSCWFFFSRRLVGAGVGGVLGELFALARLRCLDSVGAAVVGGQGVFLQDDDVAAGLEAGGGNA
jgi:hypothetical protein